MTFAVGSLVKARDREWVVLPDSNDDLLLVRPLGGVDEEVTGIYLPLEPVQPAHFDLPDASVIGDAIACRLLRDAVRLGFRASAGPFRSLAHIAVEPRPYQLVPLLMALKLDPVRILIADDVGIGKTIEAGLIAREMLDRGESRRLAVLAPPHLAEQWQSELKEKFHIDAELVLSSTATRLERVCRIGESLFEYYPYVVVSTDFIKSERRRSEFLRTCPELVIVDEAHTCAYGGEQRSVRHQRHQLLTGLVSDPNRHLILVTATPHSGNESAFRSLLALLKNEFASLPEDLSGHQNEVFRRQLAAHFVQRRRADITHFLATDTPFPNRLPETEIGYKLSGAYKAFFEKILHLARETVKSEGENRFHSRIRWWSALALLRALASSPAAAAATLRSRASTLSSATEEEADEIGRRTVFDVGEDDPGESVDITPGSDYEETDDETKLRRRLRDLAREADSLKGEQDEKLKEVTKQVKKLLTEGFQPIVFCRFIHTADYIAEALRTQLPKDTAIESVTGLLPPAEREIRVEQLADAPKRVLVCTDCLSEGINLQQSFNAVIHYDLSWNPSRHEQREGRVDRFGQPSKDVKVVTFYGTDNQIDGIILDILIRKQKKIRSSLGISVPMPIDSESVIEAVFEGLLLREQSGGSSSDQLTLFEDFFKPQREQLHTEWDRIAEREKRSRTMFAQETIKVDEVARELEEARQSIGAGSDVARFVEDALKAHRAGITKQPNALKVNLDVAPQSLKDVLNTNFNFTARFDLPVQRGEIYLNRTDPFVEALAGYVLDSALDDNSDSPAKRCGALQSNKIEKITTLLLLRLRYHIITKRGIVEQQLLAEDSKLIAFEGVPSSPTWLLPERANELMTISSDGNFALGRAQHFLTQIITGFDLLKPQIEQFAREHGEHILASHTRVRRAAQLKGVSYRVEPQLPADVLGLYLYLPGGNR